MKLPVQLILGLLIWLLSQPVALPLGDFAGDRRWGTLDSPDLTTVRPGLSAGPLKLGDTYKRATELFPVKTGIDQEFSQPPDCGRELNWVDMKNSQVGNMFIRFKDAVVFQIDVATTRCRTADGIATGDSPERVRKTFQGLRAYQLSNITANEERPLIYWVDKKKGIAFAFAPYRKKRGRYLSKIIVFKPDSEVCPPDDSINSADKRELAPYSLETPDAN